MLAADPFAVGADLAFGAAADVVIPVGKMEAFPGGPSLDHEQLHGRHGGLALAVDARRAPAPSEGGGNRASAIGPGIVGLSGRRLQRSGTRLVLFRESCQNPAPIQNHGPAGRRRLHGGARVMPRVRTLALSAVVALLVSSGRSSNTATSTPSTNGCARSSRAASTAPAK